MYWGEDYFNTSFNPHANNFLQLLLVASFKTMDKHVINMIWSSKNILHLRNVHLHLKKGCYLFFLVGKFLVYFANIKCFHIKVARESPHRPAALTESASKVSCLSLNPLSPNSDQHQISPYNINA